MSKCPICDGTLVDQNKLTKCTNTKDFEPNQCTNYYGHCWLDKDHKDNCCKPELHVSVKE